MLRTLLTFLLLSKCSAWFTPNRGIALRQVTTVLHSESPEFNTEKDTQSLPCWQDIYEQDCTMETIFSAGFVPSEWIKQLPCGAGMEDCDFPEDALLPGIRPESHTEINVMEFLNIKRTDGSSKLNS